MTLESDLIDNPAGHDLLAVLRLIERSYPGKPRIGDNATLAEEIVSLGQDPYFEFASSNISSVDYDKHGRLRLIVRFLGLLGPQGAMPLSMTAEAYSWWLQNDPAFARFLDIFNTRFLQLFFRVWSDARPSAQYDRPTDDRFRSFVGSTIGIGTPALSDRGDLPDLAKLEYAGLTGSAVKSASRLSSLIQGLFDVDVEIEERIGTWLMFEPEDRLSLGRNGGQLGVNALIGCRVHSINDKFRISIRAKDLEQYLSFLPSGANYDAFADLVFHYIGFRFEYEVELALRQTLAPATVLGKSGRLGWTAWVAPDSKADETVYRRDARFQPHARAETGGMRA
ncbi:type VI secretion protein, family [Hartmannibacter diazotrophicus]|uniref:Type VI secretion protein, family n=1 Tax=Hartmannibacter diazotrophicus TaxID=1482074 RepID=A0A2C9D6C8_9HYPH|nr:type VI secretion system baseplate subunit TssG [Hartmannibacter diazotrophicus]SON55882.1 type VI secretion protein, family [Hartmannibacter diazotrophicus]